LNAGMQMEKRIVISSSVVRMDDGSLGCA